MNTLEDLLSWRPIADKKRSIPDSVRERDFMAISAIFSDVDGNKIKKRRNELTTIITAESIKGEDFWYFLESLLIIDSLRYRKPISDAVQEIKDISQYAATEDAIIRVVRRMLADEGKGISGESPSPGAQGQARVRALEQRRQHCGPDNRGEGSGT